MIQFAVAVFIWLYAGAYKIIFLSFCADRVWFARKGGLHLLFLYFIERYRWRSSFL